MARYVAFLRAINVGGRVVKMDALRRAFETLGFTAVETFIASGNVVFESAARSSRALESKIERHLEQVLGYEVKTFVRTVDEVAAIAAYEPFDQASVARARAFCVGFLAETPPADGVARVLSLRTADDDLHVNGREVYWLARKGQGQSDFSNAVLEKTLKARSTIRGVPTVRKLAEKYGAGASARRRR